MIEQIYRLTDKWRVNKISDRVKLKRNETTLDADQIIQMLLGAIIKHLLLVTRTY